MSTVPTHKRHKSTFKHSKTIYVFTSGRVIVTVQIHSRKKHLKWPLQNGPSIPESSTICTILLQDLMERSVCRWGGGDVLRHTSLSTCIRLWDITRCIPALYHFQSWVHTCLIPAKNQFWTCTKTNLIDRKQTQHQAWAGMIS
jgi:hypothetical protein